MRVLMHCPGKARVPCVAAIDREVLDDRQSRAFRNDLQAAMGPRRAWSEVAMTSTALVVVLAVVSTLTRKPATRHTRWSWTPSVSVSWSRCSAGGGAPAVAWPARDGCSGAAARDVAAFLLRAGARRWPWSAPL